MHVEKEACRDAMFCGQASTYLWEDDEGVVHNVVQGEGRE